MKAVYVSSGCDIQKVKAHGFDTVIGAFTVAELDQIKAFGMGCIFAGDYLDHPAIIGFYLYDEPDVARVPLEEQERRIFSFRIKTHKKLVISCIEQVERLCSPNFDVYMMDIYYNATLSKTMNYLNAAVSPHFLKHLYPGNKIIPIMGLYDDNGPFLASKETLPFAKWFRSFFDGEDQAVFMWQGNGTSYRGILDRNEYRMGAMVLNFLPAAKAWAVVEWSLMGLTWAFLKVNPLLGRFKVKIGA